MRLRTTVWLLLLVLALGVVVHLVQTRDEARAREILDAQRFLEMTVEEVEHLSIQSAAVTVECGKEDGDWFIRSPLSARADASKIERILSALESLSGVESISAEQRRLRGLTLEDYGLVQPRARISVGDRVRRRVLSIGLDAPLGDLVYVKLISAGDIVAVPRTLLDVLPAAVEDLRDRALLHGDPAECTRLEIQRPDRGFIQLAVVDGKWQLLQPVSCRSNVPRVEHMLQSLFQLLVVDFTWDPPVEKSRGDAPVVVSDLSRTARLEPYGLAGDEAVRVTVWGDGHEQRQELLLGKRTGDEGELAYAASWDSDAIYTVPAAGLDAVSIPVSDLRDRTVFDIMPAQVGYVSLSRNDRTLTLIRRPDTGWGLVEPLQTKADDQACRDFVSAVADWQVLRFVDDASTNLAEYGLTAGRWSLALGHDSPAGTSLADSDSVDGGTGRSPLDPLTLMIGSRVENDDAYYALLPGGAGQVITLKAECVGDRRLDPEQVLHFRDRTMLAVEPERVRRITLRTRDGDMSIARNDGGQWQSELEGFSVLPARIEDVLFAVANLRALRIETMASGDLSRFGLDNPPSILTLGLSGESGIQKSILLGRATPHGVYAMVKGQDFVFVLSLDVAGDLVGALVTPQATPAEGI